MTINASALARRFTSRIVLDAKSHFALNRIALVLNFRKSNQKVPLKFQRPDDADQDNDCLQVVFGSHLESVNS